MTNGIPPQPPICTDKNQQRPLSTLYIHEVGHKEGAQALEQRVDAAKEHDGAAQIVRRGAHHHGTRTRGRDSIGRGRRGTESIGRRGSAAETDPLDQLEKERLELRLVEFDD